MDRDTDLLHELSPVAEQLLERHLDNAREWFPHELVPWSLGRDFEAGEEWDPSEAPMDGAVRSALFVNLLTEDNLPHYFRTINGLFGIDEAWGAWSKRWTAEEGRHAIVIRDYLTVTRSVDPVALERGRMAQVSRGEVPEPETVVDGLVYVSLQELATRISHGNTGRLLADRRGREIMARVAGDENLHHVFYRDATSAVLEIDPSAVVLAVDRQVRASRCRARASRTSPATPGPSPTPASTTSPTTTSGSCVPSCSSTGAWNRWRASPLRPRRPARGCCATSPGWARPGDG